MRTEQYIKLEVLAATRRESVCWFLLMLVIASARVAVVQREMESNTTPARVWSGVTWKG